MLDATLKAAWNAGMNAADLFDILAVKDNPEWNRSVGAFLVHIYIPERNKWRNRMKRRPT